MKELLNEREYMTTQSNKEKEEKILLNPVKLKLRVFLNGKESPKKQNGNEPAVNQTFGF